MAPPLIVHEQDAILIVTLNRPDKLNALNLKLMKLLDAAVMRLRDDPALRVMLIRATRSLFLRGR